MNRGDDKRGAMIKDGPSKMREDVKITFLLEAGKNKYLVIFLWQEKSKSYVRLKAFPH
jgi:hypothetical protein